MLGEMISCTSCSQRVCEYCWLIGSVRYFVFQATKLNLLATTYDRYTAVMSPLKYNAKINLKKVISILSIVWTFPMILTLSHLVWWIKQPKHRALYTDRVMSRFLAGYLTCCYTISRESQDCIRNQKITSSSGYNGQCKRNRNLLKYEKCKQ